MIATKRAAGTLIILVALLLAWQALHQAVGGFALWFGVRPEVTAELRALVQADITKS